MADVCRLMHLEALSVDLTSVLRHPPAASAPVFPWQRTEARPKTVASELYTAFSQTTYYIYVYCCLAAISWITDISRRSGG